MSEQEQKELKESLMIIDEKMLRAIIRSSLVKEIGFRGTGAKVGNEENIGDQSSDEGAEGSEGTHLNFKYVSIPNEQAARNAESEMSAWSGKSEDDVSVKEKLKSYWENIKDIYKKEPEASISDKTPWSAAFISYVMKDPFFRSAGHVSWKNKAEKNTSDVNANPASFAEKETYILLPIDDKVKLERGDNVWAPREGGPNSSHSDVVISPTEAIGGNVSNSVKKKKINHPFVIKKVKILGPATADSTTSAPPTTAKA